MMMHYRTTPHQDIVIITTLAYRVEIVIADSKCKYKKPYTIMKHYNYYAEYNSAKHSRFMGSSFIILMLHYF
jgi:hypothetical protein